MARRRSQIDAGIHTMNGSSSFGIAPCERTNTCPVCGKEFLVRCDQYEWAYRITEKNGRGKYAKFLLVCSWNCQRKFERDHGIPLNMIQPDEGDYEGLSEWYKRLLQRANQKDRR